MKLENNQNRLYALQSLLEIPNKILSRCDIENITEYVLYELCHNDCLELDQAAYFVDNPDFNQFRGIAGIVRNEHPREQYCIWDDPEKFKSIMSNSEFNKKVKNIISQSQKHSKIVESEFVNSIAKQLEFKNPEFHVLNIKHGNRGFFMYQPTKIQSKDIQELITNVVSFLGFCPLF